MRCKKLWLSILSAFLIGGLAGCTVDSSDAEDYIPSIPETQYYLITFNNFGGSFLFSSYLEKGTYGLNEIYTGETPKRDDTDLYTFSFNGWTLNGEAKIYNTDEMITVRSDMTFTAHYAQDLIIYHSVTFMNWDGEELYSCQVKHGEDANYVGEVPTRPSSEGNAYVFNGWNRQTTNIVEDTIFVAQYSSTRMKYTVRYLNYDGSLLDIQYVYYGDGVQYTGLTPTKPAEGAYQYTFIGWDKDIITIYEDTDFTAQYEESYRTLVVTYVNYDGSKLYETTTEYGGSAEYVGDTPTRPAEGRNDFVFSKWSVSTEIVYSNIEVRAIYEAVDRKGTTGLVYSFESDTSTYTVTGYSGDETEIFIPKEYDGPNGKCHVGRVNSNAFAYNYTITSIFVEDYVEELSSYAFAYCYNLKEVRLSQRLRIIGDKAFSNTKIESLILPATVETVNSQAFYGFSNVDKVSVDSKNPFLSIKDGFLFDKEGKVLKMAMFDDSYAQNHKTITIPEGTTEIANNALKFRYYIEKVIFPSTLEVIGENAFYNSYYIKELVFNDGLKEIKNYAFYACYNIEKLEFPESLESIGSYAFWDDNYLTSITFNNSPAIIGSSAFGSSENLTSVELGNAIKRIESQAFYSDNILESITLPSSIEFIERNAFDQCYAFASIAMDGENDNYASDDGVLFTKDFSDLIIYPNGKTGVFKLGANFTGQFNTDWKNYGFTSIEIDENNQTYCAVNNIVYSKDKKTLVFGTKASGKVTIPSETNILNDYAFYYSGIEEVDFSQSGVTCIPSYCFQGCNQLTNVVFSESIVTLSQEAFYDCDGLETIVIPNTITSMGYGAFMSCSNLKNVTIGSGVTSLPNCCFYSCSKLSTITIPSNITALYGQCFQHSGLTSIVIPETVTLIDGQCFYDCESLTEITLPNSISSISSYCFYNCFSLKSITIPESVTYISDYAFCYCNVLKSITIPNSVTGISNNCFYYCTSLESVEIPSSLTSIQSECFRNCTSLQSIVIPDSVTSLGSNCFQDCSNLTTVTLGNGLTTLSSYTFAYCYSLTTVQFSSNIQYINSYCFYNCYSLTNVSLPQNLLSIYGYAFYLCSSLGTIFIPWTVTYIESYAFSSCGDLVIFVEASSTSYSEGWCSKDDYSYYPVYYGVRGGTVVDDVIYTLDNQGKAHMSGTLSKSKNSVTIKSKVTINGQEYNITDFSCSLNSIYDLKSIVIEEGITTISAQIYPNEYGLDYIVLPSSIESISEQSNIQYAKAIFYMGTQTQFIESGLGAFFESFDPQPPIYFYSSSTPTDKDTYYMYWRYVDGVPTVWDTYEEPQTQN